MKRMEMLVVVAMTLGLVACGGEPLSEETPAEFMSQEQGLQQCGLTCSSGHPVMYLCSSSCAGSPCSTLYNAVQCEPNTGSSFYSCGTSCPSPYRVSYAYGTAQCSKSVTYLGGNNAVYCVL